MARAEAPGAIWAIGEMNDGMSTRMIAMTTDATVIAMMTHLVSGVARAQMVGTINRMTIRAIAMRAGVGPITKDVTVTSILATCSCWASACRPNSNEKLSTMLATASHCGERFDRSS